MNINVENYFSFENNIFFDASNLMDNLNEEFVLEGENYLIEEGIDTSNIYFKLLAQLYYLKNEDNVSSSVLAHVNYIIAYYIGLFLHPMNGEYIALKYIDDAIDLENDNNNIRKYEELISMIKEEL